MFSGVDNTGRHDTGNNRSNKETEGLQQADPQSHSHEHYWRVMVLDAERALLTPEYTVIVAVAFPFAFQ